MGFTGLIFAGIAVAWLAYLVPLYLRSRDQDVPADDVSVDRFADSMRVIRRGRAQLVDHDGQPLPEVEVSTPLTRRAAVTDLARIEQVAARRRRRVLVALLVITSVIIGLCALERLPWLAATAPAVLVIGFVVTARISVRIMKRTLRERYQTIIGCSDEATVILSRTEEFADTGGIGVKLTAPVSTGALWDPLPIATPTYVSKPLAPRTVRTIELGPPAATGRGRASAPVTADAPAVEPVEKPDVEVPVVPSSPAETDGDTGRAASA